MAYIDVITLAEAKTYLRIDDTLTEDDASITQMINASLAMIERYTNNYVFSRNKTYNVRDNCIRVYDYPINTVITSDVEVENYSGFSVYTLIGESLELNIGHDLPADVPDELKQCGLSIIKNDVLRTGNQRESRRCNTGMGETHFRPIQAFYNMRSREYNKRIQIWQTGTTADGFGGSTASSDTLITSSWAKVETFGLNSRYTDRATSLGITNTTNSIRVLMRKRNDITYNSINQYLMYRGEKYIINNSPNNINFTDVDIEIIATKEQTKQVTEISPI